MLSTPSIRLHWNASLSRRSNISSSSWWFGYSWGWVGPSRRFLDTAASTTAHLVRSCLLESLLDTLFLYRCCLVIAPANFGRARSWRAPLSRNPLRWAWWFGSTSFSLECSVLRLLVASLDKRLLNIHGFISQDVAVSGKIRGVCRPIIYIIFLSWREVEVSSCKGIIHSSVGSSILVLIKPVFALVIILPSAVASISLTIARMLPTVILIILIFKVISCFILPPLIISITKLIFMTWIYIFGNLWLIIFYKHNFISPWTISSHMTLLLAFETNTSLSLRLLTVLVLSIFIGAVLSYMAFLLALVASSRVLRTISRASIVFPRFGKVHPQFTPIQFSSRTSKYHHIYCWAL